MKEIIVKPENAEKINAVIKAAEGRAKERTTDFNRLVRIIEGIEKRIGKMPKKSLEGTTFTHDHRQHFPNSYKYRPSSTWVRCIYSKGSWRLIDCGRDYCPNVNDYYEYKLALSETAKAEILKRYE